MFGKRLVLIRSCCTLYNFNVYPPAMMISVLLVVVFLALPAHMKEVEHLYEKHFLILSGGVFLVIKLEFKDKQLKRTALLKSLRLTWSELHGLH